MTDTDPRSGPSASRTVRKIAVGREGTPTGPSPASSAPAGPTTARSRRAPDRPAPGRPAPGRPAPAPDRAEPTRPRSRSRAGERGAPGGGEQSTLVDNRGYTGPAVDLFDGKGWWHMLGRMKPAREGTMPAGMVLAVMLFGMLLAMFVNSGATLRKSNAKCADCFRHTIADAVDFAAGPLKAPRTAIDDLRGTGKASGGEDSSDIARRAQEETGVVPGPDGATVTTITPEKPVIRAPAPGQPLKLWVGGDSITGAFGPALQKVVTDTTLFTATADSKPSSGLTRPDYFNWPRHLYEDVAKAQDPDVMVIMFGANDAQNMPIGNAGYVRFSPEWLNEYRKRVHDVMSSLRSKDNDRLVIWMGAPVMGPNSGVEGMDKLNYIYWSEAQKFSHVVYFDTSAYLSNPDGSYALSLPNGEGTNELLRASDNIHLNVAGADRVSFGVLARLQQELDLTGAPITIPPARASATGTVERPEIPKPADWPAGAAD